MGVSILGYNVSSSIPELNGQLQTIINTINPHSYCVAKTDKQFQGALLNSNVLSLDGTGMVFAVSWFIEKKIRWF